MISLKVMLIIVAIVSFFAVHCFAQRQPPPQPPVVDDVPPFLRTANRSTQLEFEDLIMNAENMTQSELEETVTKWISKQNVSIQNAFKAFVKQLESARVQAEIAHKEAVGRFSEEAKMADKKLTDIAADPRKTNAQKAVEIEELLMKLPKSVREEIENAMKG